MKALGKGGVFHFEGFRLDRQSRVLLRRDETGALVPSVLGARALDAVDVSLREGQALAVVGESGSGKTTLARILVGLDRPDAGELTAFGQPVLKRFEVTTYEEAAAA